MKYDSMLEDFRKGPDRLTTAVKGLSEQALLYRPSADAWTIKEHVIHVVDSEANNFIRWKSTLAQTGDRVFVIDEETWTRNLRYNEENMSMYLDLFRLLRTLAYEYLKTVPEADWDSKYFVHRDLGNVTLKRTIEIYTGHVPFHLEYIERNVRAWEKTGEPV